MEPQSKEQLLAGFAAAYEQLIAAALSMVEPADAQIDGVWGPRAVVAHLAGWEVMATVRIPAILSGTPPAEFDDPQQVQMMNDATNAAFVALANGQPLVTLCDTLRRTYQRTLALIEPLDAATFQPGTYVYERTLGVIEHCREHIAEQLGGRPTNHVRTRSSSRSPD